MIVLTIKVKTQSIAFCAERIEPHGITHPVRTTRVQHNLCVFNLLDRRRRESETFARFAGIKL